MFIHLPTLSVSSSVPGSLELAELAPPFREPVQKLSHFAVSQFEQLISVPTSEMAPSRFLSTERELALSEIEEMNSKKSDFKKKKAADLSSKNIIAILGIQHAEEQIKILKAQFFELKNQLPASSVEIQSFTRVVEEKIFAHRRTISHATQLLKTAKTSAAAFEEISKVRKAEYRIKSFKAIQNEANKKWTVKDGELKENMQKIGARIRLLEAQNFESRLQIQENTIDLLGLRLEEKLNDMDIKPIVDQTKLANPHKRKRGTFVLSSATSWSLPSKETEEKEKKSKASRISLNRILSNSSPT